MLKVIPVCAFGESPQPWINNCGVEVGAVELFHISYRLVIFASPWRFTNGNLFLTWDVEFVHVIPIAYTFRMRHNWRSRVDHESGGKLQIEELSGAVHHKWCWNGCKSFVKAFAVDVHIVICGHSIEFERGNQIAFMHCVLFYRLWISAYGTRMDSAIGTSQEVELLCSLLFWDPSFIQP